MTDSARQFVDTNVLVYAYDPSAGERHDRAEHLIRDLWNQGTGCLSIQVLQEFHVTITRKVARPVTAEASARIVADLAQWTVHRPGPMDVVDAIRLQNQHQLNYWDAMILQSARQLGCERIWTENLNDGQWIGSVQVTSPFGSGMLDRPVASGIRDQGLTSVRFTSSGR